MRRADATPPRPAPPTGAVWWDLVREDDRPQPAPPLAADVRARTCIVGGGIAGASLALALARRGDDVVLVDRAFPGWGATGRNAGFLLAESDCFAMTAAHSGERVARALRAAGVATRGFVRSVGAPVTWTGSVRLASDRGEAAWFAESAAAGLDGVALVAPDAVAEGAGLAPWRAALADAGDGMTNPLLLLRAILDASARAGVRRFDGAAAHAIARARGGALVVACEGGAVRAERVVVATNSEARFLLGRDVAPIRPVRAQALAAWIDPAPAPAWRRPVYATRGGDYWRPLPDGRVLLGGLRRLDRRAEATRSMEPSRFLQARLERMLARLAGGSSGGGDSRRGPRVTVTHRWAGTMGFTADGLPRIGPAPGRAGVHLFAGWNGHGMGWAPGFADAFAAELTAPPGDASSPALAAFRPRRGDVGRTSRRP